MFNCYADYISFKNSIFDYLDRFDQDSPPHFVLLPTFSCNLRCHYCFEGKVTSFKQSMSISNLMSAFKFISKTLAQNSSPKEASISLFGGEPLLPENYPIIKEVINFANLYSMKVDIVTNGTTLAIFDSLLNASSVESIHVTIDGSKVSHDRRRVFKNGLGTFDVILNGISSLVKKGIKVTIRVNLDEQVIDTLPILAQQLKSEFKISTQVFPYIYGLSETGCAGQELFLDEEDLISKVIDLTTKFPEMSIFEWRFHGFFNILPCFYDEEYYPVQRYCGATRNQYVLGPNGEIYKCLFGIGRKEYEVGNYIKNFLDLEKVNKWKARTINIIDKCKNCPFAMLCGGGCIHKAFDKTGKILEPNCPNFEKLLPLYLRKLDTLIGA